MRIRRSLGIALSVTAVISTFGAYCAASQKSSTASIQTQSVRSAAFEPDPTGAIPQFAQIAILPPASDPIFGIVNGRASTAGRLYVGEASAPFLGEYAVPDRKNQPPICAEQLPAQTGSNGIGVDARHILYVPVRSSNYGAFPIYTYRPNCSGRGPTLYESFGTPSDVAFDNKNGKVYVSYQPNLGSGGVSVFDKGQVYPTRTLLLGPNAVVGTPWSVAVNSFGDVVMTGESGTGYETSLVEFPSGLQKHVQVLSPPGLDLPYGLEFDRNDNLIVANALSNSIVVYAPPYNAAPTLTIRMNGSPTLCKLDQANHNLYVLDFSNGSVDVFAYPSGVFEYSITNGLNQGDYVSGIAVDSPSN